MKFRDGVRFGEHYFQSIRQYGFGTFGPGHLAFGSELGNSSQNFGWSSSHYAAAFLPEAGDGVRNTMARLSGSKYFFAAACTCSRVTVKNPSRMVLASCGSLSNKVKQARRCIKPYLGMYPPRPPSKVE